MAFFDLIIIYGSTVQIGKEAQRKILCQINASKPDVFPGSEAAESVQKIRCDPQTIYSEVPLYLEIAPYRRGGFFFLILPIDKVGW